MTDPGSKSSRLLEQLVANSLFTPRQISIISKRLQGSGRAQNISSGAYYRQVKQSRDKAIAVLYSAILLQSSGALQPEALSALGRLADQLGVIFASEGSDVLDDARLEDVMSVMDHLVKRVCKL
ncbi:MAG: hypothetical protein ACREAY_01980 [Nitrososphaera sp.]|uniref:hypothetical protein n=1 Tax=Nitrososphaera sp. TaxID=1971748 RepID=UPI003D6F9DA9